MKLAPLSPPTFPITFIEDPEFQERPSPAPGAPLAFAPPPFLSTQRIAFDPHMRKLRDDFARAKRHTIPLVPEIHLNTATAREIAALYDVAPAFDHLDPKLPEVIDAATREIHEHFNYIVRHSSIRIEWVDADTKYSSQAIHLIDDVRSNRTIAIFKGGKPHPIWDVPVRPDSFITTNHMLRVVHDLWGHCADGNNFSPSGEAAAYFSHTLTFSPLALRYIATEFRAQSLWFNFGPHLWDELGWKGHPLHPRHIPPAQRPYPPQKVFRMPQCYCG